MKACIIDLGTNTFNLLIAEINHNNSFDVLLNTKAPVMLGSEGINEGYISDKAFTRAYDVLRDFSRLINDFECKKVVAFGTSAIRSASNSNNFIEKIKNDFNINIETISGDKEATLIYRGVSQAVTFTSENYLILDIGGGSNELIIANKDGVLWQHSFALGGARLLDKIQPSDPITVEEVNGLNIYLEKELVLLTDALKDYSVTQLVGSSGAFDSLAEVLCYKKENVPILKASRSNIISLQEFELLYNEIIDTQRIERLMIPGLEAIRVDTIVMANIFIKYILKVSGVKGIIQSAFSLKEGVAANFLN